MVEKYFKRKKQLKARRSNCPPSMKRSAFYIMINKEIWKDIPGYEGLYQVSNLGRIKRLGRLIKHSVGGGSHFIKEEIMKGCFSKKGYKTVGLSIAKNHKIFRQHRLVALAFIPNPENKPEVNHINGIKTDNRVENLEWVTSRENSDHAFKEGLKIRRYGETNFNSKLTEKDVLEIRKSNLSTKELCLKYNVSKTTINGILKNIYWKHLI